MRNSLGQGDVHNRSADSTADVVELPIGCIEGQSKALVQRE